VRLLLTLRHAVGEHHGGLPSEHERVRHWLPATDPAIASAKLISHSDAGMVVGGPAAFEMILVDYSLTAFRLADGVSGPSFIRRLPLPTLDQPGAVRVSGYRLSP